jgi:ribosomal protein L7/L12
VNQQLINALSECIGHCQTDEEMRTVLSTMVVAAKMTLPQPLDPSPMSRHVEELRKRWVRLDNGCGYDKIGLIKYDRECTGRGLKESKDFIEAIFG